MEVELDVADLCHVLGFWEARVGVVGTAVVDSAGPIRAEVDWLRWLNWHDWHCD